MIECAIDTLMESRFIHLHLHSQYTMLKGAIKIKPLFKRCVDYGMDSVAITDSNHLHGAIDFYSKAKIFNIKPIIGCELDFDLNGSVYHLPVLVKNNDGYRNLVKLLSVSQKTRKTINFEMLKDYAGGLICLSGCLGGVISQSILKNGVDEGSFYIERIRDIFDPDSFYLEIQNHNFPEQTILNTILSDIGKKLGIPLVATNDCHFLDREDAFAQKVLESIETKEYINEGNVPEEMYFKSQEEMIDLFQEYPEAISNTIKIKNQCTLQLELGVPKLPKFSISWINKSEDDLFEEFSKKGFQERLQEFEEIGKILSDEQKKEYQSRLDFEIKMIKKMNFSGYFLIVQDFICWAKSNDIPVGPGRGSGAGSLVAYSLKITDLDPIEHELLFERFLNPDRVSMPDFDIDFCKWRRDEVVEYVRQRYGSDSVGLISTFQLLKSKAVLKDIGRVLGQDFSTMNQLTKLIPPPKQGVNFSIEQALKMEPKLAEKYEKDKETAKIIDLGIKLENLTRHSGIHAAGVVISEGPLENTVPILVDEKDSKITQYNKDDVELAGLVKFDFLGLKTLTVIKLAVDMIRKRPDGKSKNFNISKIPLSSKDKNPERAKQAEKTYQLLKTGKTIGVFQVESEGMQKFFSEMKPDQFNDIVAAVALYRPGPIGSQMHLDYIHRKHGKAKITYPHPLLQEALQSTYGVITYQEQVMSVARVLAGYTLGQADLLRRAMGKKKPEEMAKQKNVFIDGCKKNNVDEKIAKNIFELLEYFSAYGFNRSHAAAYALISYQTAFLKAHYPTELMNAILCTDIGKAEKLSHTIKECKRLGIEVLSPDINQSERMFRIDYSGEKEKIRIGLAGIRGVGDAAINVILEARKNCPFKDLFDCMSRTEGKGVGKKVIQELISCGAFDSFQKDRATLIATVESTFETIHKSNKKKPPASQIALFSSEVFDRNFSYTEMPLMSTEEKLTSEKRLLGMYLSGNPLNPFLPFSRMLGVTKTNKLKSQIRDDSYIEDGSPVSMIAIAEDVKEKFSKKGDKLIFLKLEDEEGSIESMIPPAIVNKIETITSGKIYFVEGKIKTEEKFASDQEEESEEEEERKIIINKIYPIMNAIQSNVFIQNLELILHEEEENKMKEKINKILKLASSKSGIKISIKILSKEGFLFYSEIESKLRCILSKELLYELVDMEITINPKIL